MSQIPANQNKAKLSKNNKSSSANHSLFQKHRSMEAMLDFVEQVNQIESLEEAIWHLARHTIKSLDFEDCVIYLLQEDGKSLKQVAAFGPKNPQEFDILYPLTLRIGQGIVGKAAAECRSIVIKDTRQHQEYVVDDQARLSELAVPIVFQNKLLGVIDSEHSQANFFNHEDQRYLELLATVLASKISFESNIQALEKTIGALEKAKVLSEVYLKISALTYNSTTIEDFYLHLHHLIAKQVNTQSFFVVLLDLEKDQYSCPYIHDEQDGGQFDFDFDNKAFKHSLVAEVIRTQQAKIVGHAEMKERLLKSELIRQGPIPQSWLAVPFSIDPNLQGTIALQSYHADINFNQADKEFLTFLGQHIATAINHKLKDHKLQYQALHDEVTGLANRSLYLDRIEHAFSRTNRNRSSDLAVLYLDFDDFKLINDNYGHLAGDEVLRVTAERLQSQLRDKDTLARIGGDEFAILLEDLESASYTITVAQRILKVMQQPIVVDNQSLYVSISIGIAIRDENTKHAEELLKKADHAMYHAKENGKNSFQIYEASLHQSIVYARQVLKELEIAIAEKQLLFFFQPIVNLTTMQIVGFEALMRWQHPTRGIISPEEFIHVAEQNDLIRAIDSQLLDSVAAHLRSWQITSKLPLYISINISAQRFVDSHLIVEIKSAIEKYQLPVDSIVVEVTEHILMVNIAKARHLFHQLKLLGVKISLDDFGTGYSSLSYLNQMPFDVIKIDRSFVTHISDDNLEYPIINTIVALANTLNMELVAEGIESQVQLEVLQSLNCQFGQGYFLSLPVSANQIDQLINKGDLRLC